MHLTKVIALGQQARVTVRGGMFVAALMLAVTSARALDDYATAEQIKVLTAKGP